MSASAARVRAPVAAPQPRHAAAADRAVARARGARGEGARESTTAAAHARHSQSRCATEAKQRLRDVSHLGNCVRHAKSPTRDGTRRQVDQQGFGSTLVAGSKAPWNAAPLIGE